MKIKKAVGVASLLLCALYLAACSGDVAATQKTGAYTAIAPAETPVPSPEPTTSPTSVPTSSPTSMPTPSPTPEPTPTPPSSAEVSFAFTGDLMFHRSLLSASRSDGKYDFTPVFEKVAPNILGADFAVANLEAPVYDPQKSTLGEFSFAAPPEAITDFAAAGFDVFTTANNHATDQGAAGLSNTIDVIRKAGLKVTGTWRDQAEREEILMLEHNGVKIAILAYGRKSLSSGFPKGMGSNLWSMDRLDDMTAAVQRAKAAGADAVIVSIHFGNEYTFAPSSQQKKTVDAMRAAGAIAVIGHHPHVLQPMFMDADSKFFAAYSLGNIVTTTSTTQRQFAAILKLTVRKDLVTGDVAISGLSYVPTWTRMLKGADGKARLRVYDIRQALSDCEAGVNPEIPKKYLKELTNGYEWIRKTLGTECLEPVQVK